jgi:hypothetical protein
MVPGEPPPVLISYATEDGEEREERWPSVESFLGWARKQTAPMRFTAYQEDDDGEWVIIDQGRSGGARG